MTEKTKIIVIGASGILGGLICSELSQLFKNRIQLFIGDYRKKRGEKTANTLNEKFCETDIRNIEKLKTSLSDKDIVIVAINQTEPVIQKICLENSITCIDVTAFYSFAKKVQELYSNHIGSKSTSVLMAGFFPGLSGLLLQKAVKDFDEIDETNITLLQNTNAKAGATGIIDMLKIVSTPVKTIFYDKEINISGFSFKRTIIIPQANKKYKTRLIYHSEKELLLDKLPLKNLNYWTAWNNSTFNILISVLRRTGLLYFVTHKMKKETLKNVIKHDKNKSEETVLIADVIGLKEKKEERKNLVINTFSDYGTTAKIVAALAKIVLTKKSEGICFPFEITTLNKILDIMDDKRIKYYEY
jgi:saccharopine dehydrogenase-like NADP-dependent oxidoreductase